MKRMVIAGCGYIGARVARSARASGFDVACMVRSPEHGALLAATGFTAFVVAFDDPAAMRLPEVDVSVIYYLVPPPADGIRDPWARNFCAALMAARPPEKIVYMSATSVYAETNGGVVTETSPAFPASAMGQRRLDAEAAFREYGAATAVPLVILRVSGISGPGRLPVMQISQGQPLLREEEAGPGNRIHADDLVQVCLAAAEKGADGDVFNVSDGHPSSMTAYFNAVADALGLARQPQVTLEEARRVMSPQMVSYVTESRVVDNSRMLARLGITLRYPALEGGLTASIEPLPPAAIV